MPPLNRGCHVAYRCQALMGLGLLSLLGLSLLVPVSSAEVEYVDQDFVIDRHEFHTVRIDGINGGSIEVDVELDDEDPIDIMLMDLQEYNNYQTGVEQIRYIYGRLEVLALSFTWEAPDNGTYFLVLDNTDDPEGGADSYYTVSGHFLVKIDRKPVVQNRIPNVVEDKQFYPWLGIAMVIFFLTTGTALMLRGFMHNKPRRRAVVYSPNKHAPDPYESYHGEPRDHSNLRDLRDYRDHRLYEHTTARRRR